MTQAHQIGPNKNSQFTAFLLTSVAITRMTLMLHSYPEFIHFREIQQNEINGVVNVARI